MATYPPVTERERDAALARIRARHVRREDTRWSEAGVDSDTAASEVLSYLRRRNTQLPAGLAADDIWDELVLSAWVYWDERRRERELLHRARRLGLSLADLGRYLGIGTRQGMRDYLDRLDALLADYDRVQRKAPPMPATGDGTTDPLARYVGTTRAQRGADVHAARAHRAAAHTKPARRQWIAAHHTRVAAAVSALLDQAGRLGIIPCPSEDTTDGDGADGHSGAHLGDYLSWLADDLARDEFNPGTFGAIGLVLGELRIRPDVAALPRNHGLRLAIADADRLRADYADLKPSSER